MSFSDGLLKKLFPITGCIPGSGGPWSFLSITRLEVPPFLFPQHSEAARSEVTALRGLFLEGQRTQKPQRSLLRALICQEARKVAEQRASPSELKSLSVSCFPFLVKELKKELKRV